MINIQMVVLIKSYFCQKGESPEEKELYLHEISKEVLSEWGVEKLGKITKLFLDYDCDVEGKSAEWIRIEKKSIRDLLIEHSVHYANGFVFTETAQPDKISFHIIFKRIAINREEFHPELERELFSKILGEGRFKYPDVDVSVYQKKLWFRLPYGTLSGKPYPHIPYYPNDLSDYIVSLHDDTQTKSYEHHPYLINKKFEELMNAYQYEREEDEEHNLTARQERIVEYLEIIKPERFMNHKEWFQLMCLCRGNNIPQHIFLDLSEVSGYKKFNREQCIKQWDALQPKRTFGFPLLHIWLEEDGVDWKKLFPSLSPIVRAVKNLEINDFGCTDQGLASILYQFYNGNLYYTSSHGWIHWNGVKWETGNDNIIFYPICKMLSNELQVYIKTQMNKKEAKLEKLMNVPKEERDKVAIDIAALSLSEYKKSYDRYRHIQSVSCMKNVLQMSISLFKDEKILDTFDMKPHLFSFDNKSIDIRTGEVIEITKEQRILTTCGYNIPERKENDFILVKTLLTEIMGENLPNFLRNLSVVLYGGNNNECFQVWTGVGRNGKGVVDHMTQRVMGNYYNSLPITELTEDSKGQGRTSSEIANLRWSRMVVSTEPEKGAVLKVGKIKQLTGKDKIVARQLYHESFSFLPKFSLFIQCNEIPKFSKLDDAIQKRLLITPFPFQFVDNPERDYQRPIDTSIKDKISENDSYRNGLLWLLVDAYIEHKGKIVRSDVNDNELDEIILDNSPLTEFLSDYVPSVDFIRINDLYDTYIANYEKVKKQEFKRLILEIKSIKTEEDKSHGMKVFIRLK